MGLLDTYNSMLKQAEEQQVDVDRNEVINEYLGLAKTALDRTVGEGKYDTDLLSKTAVALIENDVEDEEQMSKVAEYIEAGQIMGAHAWETFKALAEANK